MYVYEFLYRGRVKDEDSAYHVILADEIDLAGQKKHVETPPMTASQAEALGFPLPAILADINATMLAERDSARAEKDAIKAERDELASELSKGTK